MGVTKKEPKKRGWVFDQLMIVGQLEAAMCHNDEQICNLRQDLENVAEPTDIPKLSDELSANYTIIALDYKTRVDALNQIFDSFPNADRHYYCQLKHRAALFVMAAENFHARDASPEAEATLVGAGKSLAMTVSLAFGFEIMDCLRCMDEAIGKLKK